MYNLHKLHKLHYLHTYIYNPFKYILRSYQLAALIRKLSVNWISKLNKETQKWDFDS